MKTRKVSRDEVTARRKDAVSDSGVVRAVRGSAPPSWDADQRTARFVMSSQAVDRYGDIVVTEGIDLTEFNRNPIAPLFHNTHSAWPVGRWEAVEKVTSARPPRLEGTLRLLPSGGPIPEVDQCAFMIEHGVIRAVSIGFRPDWDEVEAIMDEEDDWWTGLRFNAVELLECSVVQIPANPKALAKGFGVGYVEEVLDNWSRTPEGLIVPRKAFEESYRIMKNASTRDPRFNDARPVALRRDGEVLVLKGSWPALTTISETMRAMPGEVFSDDGEGRVRVRVSGADALYRRLAVDPGNDDNVLYELVENEWPMPSGTAEDSFVEGIRGLFRKLFPAKAVADVDPPVAEPEPAPVQEEVRRETPAVVDPAAVAAAKARAKGALSKAVQHIPA